MIGPDLQDVKDALRVIHDSDDELLLRLINSATLEFLRYRRRLGPDDELVLGISSSSSSSESEPLPDDVVNGIILLVQQDYDGDPAQRDEIRRVAETLWLPHRESFVI